MRGPAAAQEEPAGVPSGASPSPEAAGGRSGAQGAMRREDTGNGEVLRGVAWHPALSGRRTHGLTGPGPGGETRWLGWVQRRI